MQSTGNTILHLPLAAAVKAWLVVLTRFFVPRTVTQSAVMHSLPFSLQGLPSTRRHAKIIVRYIQGAATLCLCCCLYSSSGLKGFCASSSVPAVGDTIITAVPLHTCTCSVHRQCQHWHGWCTVKRMMSPDKSVAFALVMTLDPLSN